MKKRWLSLCGIYFLGLATVPGLMLAERWRQDSHSPRPKFTEAVFANSAAEKSAPRDEVAQFEQSVLAEYSEPAFTDSELSAPRPAHKPQTTPRPLTLDFDDSLAADLKPRPRGTSLDDEFDSFEREPVTVPKRSPTAVSKEKADVPDGIESLAEPNPSDEQKTKLTSLREKLAELMKAKAELVNEQTLEETIFSLEKQISNLHAAQKLLSAQQILKALAEEFPDSPAAARAQRMLEAAGFKRTPTVSTDPLSALPTYR